MHVLIPIRTSSTHTNNAYIRPAHKLGGIMELVNDIVRNTCYITWFACAQFTASDLSFTDAGTVSV